MSSDGPLVALVGVSDLAVVVTDDAVLVARRDDSSSVKMLVEADCTLENSGPVALQILEIQLDHSPP